MLGGDPERAVAAQDEEDVEPLGQGPAGDLAAVVGPRGRLERELEIAFEDVPDLRQSAPRAALSGAGIPDQDGTAHVEILRWRGERLPAREGSVTTIPVRRGFRSG